MSISNKIINQIVEETFSNAQEMGKIVMIPNTFDVYIHSDDYKDLRHLLHFLREQITIRLDEEINNRSKPIINEGSWSGVIKKVNRTLGINIIPEKKSYKRVREVWDINFQECPDGKIDVENEPQELKKGDFGIISSFSSTGIPDLDSQYPTKFTIETKDGYQTKSELKTSKSNDVSSKVGYQKDDSSCFATLIYKHKSLTEQHSFLMLKEKIIVGRKTETQTIDLPLENVSENISHNHLEISFNSENNKFYVKRLGDFEATVNGEEILDFDQELSHKSRISLGGGEVLIDFYEGLKK